MKPIAPPTPESKPPSKGQGSNHSCSTAVLCWDESAKSILRPPQRVQPVLIGGEHRSGTTLLSLILDSHPAITVGPELDFLLPANLGPEIEECCALLVEDDRRVRGVGVETADLRFHYGVQFVKQCHRFGIEFETLAELVRTAATERGSELEGIEDRIALLDAIGNFRCMDTGKPRWGLKVQRELALAPVFKGVWPKAQFVHVVRDGRDVAASHVRSDYRWTHSTVRAAARSWVEVLDSIDAVREQVEIIDIRYEDLVLNPAETLRGLLKKLHLSWSDRVLQHAEIPHALLENSYRHPSAKAAGRPLTGEAIGRYQTDLSPQELAEFNQIAGRWLERFDYPFSSGGESLF